MNGGVLYRVLTGDATLSARRTEIMMSAAPDTVTTALAPARSPRASLRALGVALREAFAGMRQAIDRMNRLIDEARLDRGDD
jgi:hypothetical protein